MRLSITHEMGYTYDSPVRSSTQYLRLCPRDTARQKVLKWKLETPGQAMRTQDGYGNVLHVLTLDKPVSEISITAFCPSRLTLSRMRPPGSMNFAALCRMFAITCTRRVLSPSTLISSSGRSRSSS